MTLTGRMQRTTDDDKRKRRKGGNVIHVAFGSGGGRLGEPTAATGTANAVGSAAPSIPPPPDGREPVTDLFSPARGGQAPRRHRRRACGRSTARRSSRPRAKRNGKRAYTFQDLIALRATRELLAHRVRLRDVARAIGALRHALPRVTRPLQELRIVERRAARRRARRGAARFEPRHRADGARLRGRRRCATTSCASSAPRRAAARARTAYDLYVRASALDEDPATFDEAEALYGRAIELDPSLAIAYTNLGNIRFRRGDEPRRRGALPPRHRDRPAPARGALQPRLRDARARRRAGAPSRTSSARSRATRASPTRTSTSRWPASRSASAVAARPHWSKYLELEPTGTWADIAREHLKG